MTRAALAVLGLLVVVSLPRGLAADDLVIRNDTRRLDTAGNEIRAQGGSILQVGDTWYWYGFDGEVPAKNPKTLYNGVLCYRSKDLVNWTFVGESFNDPAKNPNRLDVVRNAFDGRFYMFCKHMDRRQGVGVAVADTPESRFEWKGFLELPDSVGGGDQSVFVDDNGKTYLVYTPWQFDAAQNKIVGNRHLTIAELSPDFSRVERIVASLKDTKVEAPAIFKRDGRYYWMNSAIHWWFSSPTSWMTAENLAGPWTPLRTLQADPASALPERAALDTYNCQHDFVLPVRGTEGTVYLFCGDRYGNYTTWGTGRTVWLPLTFQGDTPVLDWHQSWRLDAKKGKWEPVP